MLKDKRYIMRIHLGAFMWVLILLVFIENKCNRGALSSKTGFREATVRSYFLLPTFLYL